MPSTGFAKSAALFIVASSLFARSFAHGFVRSVTINGQYYNGFDETTWEDKASGSPILITSYLVPLYDVWSSDIACGLRAKAAEYVAPINAGDSVQWMWKTHNEAPWTHTMGTHRSFIGSCNGNCKGVNPNDVNWIELPREFTGPQNYGDDGLAPGDWPVMKLHNGEAWSDKIPNLPAGQYLLRNEVTAAHFSNQRVGSPASDGHEWGMEFYPTCIALEIKNTDGSWGAANTYKFPGAYQVDQDGHYNPNLYSNTGATVLAALGSGQAYSNSYSNTPTNNSGNNNSNNNSNNTPSNNTPSNNTPSNNTPGSSSSSAAAASPSPSTHVCKRGSRRSLAAKARKMKRSHLARRRSEH